MAKKDARGIQFQIILFCIDVYDYLLVTFPPHPSPPFLPSLFLFSIHNLFIQSVNRSVQISPYHRVTSWFFLKNGSWKQDTPMRWNDQFYWCHRYFPWDKCSRYPLNSCFLLGWDGRLFTVRFFFVFLFFPFNPCPLIPIKCIFFCFCDLYLLIIRDTNGNYTSKFLVLGKKRFVLFRGVSWLL